MALMLTCLQGEAVPTRLPIDATLELGRDPHCDVRLLDDRCSRYHARLRPVAGGVELCDNDSSNGTWVGEQRIDRQQLVDGDRFRIGAAFFAIEDPDGAGQTRLMADDGTALEVESAGATRIWQEEGSAGAQLAPVHAALQEVLRATTAERPTRLAEQAARICAADRAAVVDRGRVRGVSGRGMGDRLAQRLATGTQVRRLQLGPELAGRTIAAEAIGAALTAPLAPGMHLVLARHRDGEPFGVADADLLALLAGEAAPCFAPVASIVEHGLVGDSPLMQQLVARVQRIAAVDTTVLITGESGTGKELVARALHRSSGRRDTPFVAVNCAAIADQLVETELFGHTEGAFTGAQAARSGRFRQADGGVLFLDEIGELPLPVQATLLRALQEGRVEPVGSDQSVAIDVRIVAATNRDLQEEVDAGRFRADLFYRLDVIRIHTPALRDHLEDLPVLVEHLLQRAAEDTGLPVPPCEPAFLDDLARRDWPGNVRQLSNVLTRALVLVDGSLRPEHIGEVRPASTTMQSSAAEAGAFPTLAAMEAMHVQAALARTDWNKSAAARLLGISRPTLHKKIADYGLAR